MNNKELISYIKNGVTLDNKLQKTQHKNGYYVSMLGYEKTFTPRDLTAIKQTITEYQKIIKNNSYKYIGLWNSDGLVYIDISQHYKNKKDAIKTGIKNKQLAIYDIEKHEDIKLLKNTYILYKYNKFTNDIKYIKEYYDIDNLTSDFRMNKNVIRQYIYKTIDGDIKNLLRDRFIIIKDSMYYKDFIELIEG